MKVLVIQSVRLFVTPWTVAHQAPLSMGFSRQEYWIGFCSVQSLNHDKFFATPWTAAMPGFSVRHQLPELAQTHVH